MPPVLSPRSLLSSSDLRILRVRILWRGAGHEAHLTGLEPLPVCRPVLNQYVHTQEEMTHYSNELFKIIKEGGLKLSVYKEYELSTEGVRQTQLDISKSFRKLSKRGHRTELIVVDVTCSES